MDGASPALQVESSKASGIELSFEDTMSFADVEPIGVLAIH